MAALLERTKKQLRSVLISEQYGVAADRLERDYRELVSGQSFQQCCPVHRWETPSPSSSWASCTW